MDPEIENYPDQTGTADLAEAEVNLRRGQNRKSVDVAQAANKMWQGMAGP